MSRFCKGDSEKRADVEEICNRFPSLQMCVDHARGLIVVATDDEKKTMFPDGRPIPAISVFLWAMNEAEKSPDPRQRARWYEYRSRRRPPPPPVEGLVGVVVAVPAAVKQVIVHSDSDGECSEDVLEDSEQEQDVEDSEKEQVVVDVEDDSEGEVAPADDDVYVVATGDPAARRQEHANRGGDLHPRRHSPLRPHQEDEGHAEVKIEKLSF